MDLWSYMPQQDLRESMEWLTDIIRCKSNEQRFALRDQPRLAFTLKFVMDSDKFSEAKAKAKYLGEKEFAIPVWTELTELGSLTLGDSVFTLDTNYARYKSGGMVVIYEDEDTWEILTVDSFDASSVTTVETLSRNYTNALIAPAKSAYFATPFQAARGGQDFVTASASFHSVDSEDLSIGWSSPFDSYLSHDVVTDRSIVISNINERFQREQQLQDNLTGIVWVGSQYSYPIQTTQISWDTQDRQERWAMMQLLHNKRGKWRGFWVPTWNPDIIITTNITSTDTVIIIQDIGYEDYQSERHIMIELNNGTRYYFNILYGISGSPGEEILTLSSSAGVNILIADISFVSFINFMRFDSDRAELRYMPAGRTTVTMPVMETILP